MTNFAWALHAGAAYNVNQNFAIELSYRYLNLGDGKTGDTINFDGTNIVNNPMTVKDITSHDVRLGVRFTCCDDGTSTRRPAPYAAAMPTPVYSQPLPQPQVLSVPQTYAPPPPVYSQPQYAPPPVYQPQYAPPPPQYQQQPQYQPQYAPQQPLSRRG